MADKCLLLPVCELRWKCTSFPCVLMLGENAATKRYPCQMIESDDRAHLSGYQHHLSTDAALQYSNMRRCRFGQSHLTTDDRTQRSLCDPGQDVPHNWLHLCCCR